MAETPSRAPGPFRPTRLGHWEVIAKLAGGGMSAVYLGRRTEPRADIPNVVALKIVRHDVAKNEHLVKMFLEEGALISRLDHPNIVRTLEVSADADHDYIAMELMLGKTFAAIHDALVTRHVRLNADIAAFVAARVADALHYAHELTDTKGAPLSLVHRDVNPANVFATFGGQIKLFDFGLARTESEDRGLRHLVAGKLSYLSPEQIMQLPLDRRSDVFSLGTTFWELLTGRRLFHRDTNAETVRAVQLGPIPDPRTIAPEVPEELARIARRSLERNRDHRYASAADFAHDLDAFVLGRTPTQGLTARLAELVDTLFPGEQKRQSGWLKPAITSTRSTVSPSTAPPPVSPRREPEAKPISRRPPPPLPARPPGSVAPPRPTQRPASSTLPGDYLDSAEYEAFVPGKDKPRP